MDVQGEISMSIYAEIKMIGNSSFGKVKAVYDNKQFRVTAFPWLWVDVAGHSPAPPTVYDELANPWWYDSGTDSFTDSEPVITLPTGRRIINPTVFWFKIISRDERAKTLAALSGIDLAGVNFGTAKNRWILKSWYELTLRNPINLDEPETIWSVNAMETSGIIGPGRAAEILA